MKKYLLLFLLGQTIQAQMTTVISTVKAEYKSAEVTLSNGNVLNGYIKDFTVPKTVEFRGVGYDFKSIESRLYMNRKDYSFRKEKDGETENLKIADIKSIKIFESDTTLYERLKLRTFNNKLEPVDVDKEVMVPLIRKDKISLYGVSVYDCTYGCSMIWVLAYIKNEKDDYAYIPIDANTMTLFNTGKLGDKFARAFEEVGKDCPDFVAYIKKEQANQDKKAMKEDYKAFHKSKKEKLKKVKGKERARLESQMDIAYFLKNYNELIDEYLERCD